ncbi:MAG: type 4a pilus biogenesis protein PilO, partial [Solirubrobacterales bacterium]
MNLTSSNRLIVAMVAIVALVVLFWMLLLSPRRKEAAKLSDEVAQVQESLTIHQGEVQQALAAKKRFPAEYRQLVVLGKAVPNGDETGSLLVQLNQLAHRSGVVFQTLLLSSSGGGESETSSAPAEENASPTEVGASLLPLGATVGPAGLAVMPYQLEFKGTFFQMAKFIEGLDSFVKTKNAAVDVTGRLITIGGFKLAPDESAGFPLLEANFGITTYVLPPEVSATAGATPEAPETVTATPASAT